MESHYVVFVALGGLLALGLISEYFSARTIFPRATLLMVAGLALGPAGLHVLPDEAEAVFDATTYLALVMIGFLLGGQFRVQSLRVRGATVIVASIAAVVMTMAVLVLGLLVLGFALEIALLLGAVAAATAPTATVDVIRESEAKGPFTKMLLGIVAIDDLWGVILFSLVLAAVQALAGRGEANDITHHLVRDVGGAVAVGLVLGVPSALLTGRVRPGEPSLLEALALVFLCTGASIYFDVSYLIAAMVMGTAVANLARHHSFPFHAIERIESPFLIIFFVIAGASLEPRALTGLGFIGIAYVVLRILGRLAGGYVGGRLTEMTAMERRWIGWALLPQAGVAIGMALYAAEQLPELGKTILPVVIASTVFFELLGPVLLRIALKRVGEIPERSG